MPDSEQTKIMKKMTIRFFCGQGEQSTVDHSVDITHFHGRSQDKNDRRETLVFRNSINNIENSKFL